MEKRTGVINFAGHPMTLLGPEIKVGAVAPDFTVLTTDLAPFSLKDTSGVRVISVIPSVDTSVCDVQTRRFNEEAAKLDVTILSISVDLPFALKKYCAAHGIEKVKTLSDHKDLNFGLTYGFVIEELRLLTRGVIVIDGDNVVRHVEYVPSVGEHPNYDAVLAALKEVL